MHTANEAVLDVVKRWHAAANAGDADALAALATPDVELVGPRGANRGHEILRQWMGRAGLTYAPRRWFTDGAAAVVVEEEVTWRDTTTGERLDQAVVGSRFLLRDGRVACYARHPDIAEALAAAGLAQADEVAVDA